MHFSDTHSIEGLGRKRLPHEYHVFGGQILMKSFKKKLSLTTQIMLVNDTQEINDYAATPLYLACISLVTPVKSRELDSEFDSVLVYACINVSH